jgi:hypothetical protein
MRLAPKLQFLSIVLAGGGVAALATNAPPPAPPPNAAAIYAHVVAVDVHPERIELANPYAAAQVLLSGRLTDGEFVDVTREAKFDDAGGLVAIDARGRVRPRRDGEGTLHATVAGRDVAIPVAVRGADGDYEPSFCNDVIPVMSRLGCNAGTCHGSAKGKAGFKLSLRGYDPAFDHQALTDDLAGRRFNRAVAEQSLFLLKPTASVPHEGGRRMDVDSNDYKLLKAWVESGVRLDKDAPKVVSIDVLPKNPVVPLPGMAQQMAVIATYADGRTRDVTGDAVVESNDNEIATVESGSGLVTGVRRGDAAVLARYSGRYAATRLVVMGDRTGFEWKQPVEHGFVDELVDAKLKALKAAPSELCSDAEFLRRVQLDLTGLPPTARDVRIFLADKRPSRLKREETIDRMIGSTEFVEHWTNKWSDLLQVNSKFLGVEGAARLREWIRAAIASNQPYDQFVAEVLDASGSTYQNPPAAYWKILRLPDVAMENTTQLFLGVRFSCNKCHDHPFERWTQDQHWQLAAYFAQVGRSNVAGSAMMAKANDNRPDDDGLAFDEMIADVGQGEVMHPNKNVTVAPRFPYEHAGALPADGTRRQKLVAWITAKENPYFAKSYVNRVWSYFLGVGLIDPIDDIRASNPPTNPELLERLTQTFIESGFDVRALMRLICRSRTYQTSLTTNAWNEDDTLHYAHALARRLPAETLFDCIGVATGHRQEVPGVRPGTRADELLDPSMTTADNFLSLFGRPPRESACECERSSGMSLGQALNLVNGPTVADAIEDSRNAIGELATYERDPKKVIDELYVRFLSRPATAAEVERFAPRFDANDAANFATLAPADAAKFKARRAAWEAALPKVTWSALENVEARSAGGATLTRQADGSFLASGTLPEKDTYTITAFTSLADVTALRLTVLPDPSLPKNGPGRSENGNFVVGEVRVTAIPLTGSAGGKVVAVKDGSADFAQQQFDPNQVTDGNPVTGWAIHPSVGVPHRAVWELAENVGAAGGTLLAITLDQEWGGGHEVGRFKLEVSNSARPVRVSPLPDEVLSAVSLPVEKRTAEVESLLHRTFLASAPDLVDQLRLSAAQDLAWALATSPAFLFNR